MTIRVATLYSYPGKSCKGISLQQVAVGRMGIDLDRRWMVIDEETGMFVAQRADHGLGVGIKSICLVETSIAGDKLVFSAPNFLSLAVPLSGMDGRTVKAQVWRHVGEGIDQGEAAALWFTRFLSKERPGRYRLVWMPPDGVRKTTHGEGYLAFADGGTFLIISQPSLDDLNGRMAEVLPMNRFRPNIVLEECDPYEEDHLRRIKIGSIEFIWTHQCSRCPVTMTDQETAERGKEPLRTLATYRRTSRGVMFGSNFNHIGAGMISVGDPVEVLEWS